MANYMNLVDLAESFGRSVGVALCHHDKGVRESKYYAAVGDLDRILLPPKSGNPLFKEYVKGVPLTQQERNDELGGFWLHASHVLMTEYTVNFPNGIQITGSPKLKDVIDKIPRDFHIRSNSEMRNNHLLQEFVLLPLSEPFSTVYLDSYWGIRNAIRDGCQRLSLTDNQFFRAFGDHERG